MKKTLFALGLLAGFFYSLSVPTGCYYDNEEDLYGGDTTACDTANLSYADDIKPILVAKCYKCHSNANSVGQGAPAFEDFAAIQLRAVGNVGENQKLLNRINDPTIPMPPLSEGGLLPDCERSKIEAWVKAGAPDN